ncbi:MAG TPA: hypothetical protein VMU25_01045 [Candidatus Paceibacterota bacterium]|nr:hypothetical protein [Candidatus Paceibacterota bacterium]
MEVPAPASFIPHEAITPTTIRRDNSLQEVVLLISILIFVVSLALAGGVFLYTQYLQSSNASKLQSLNRAEAAFDPSLVQQLTRLDSRMHIGEQLLSAHLAPTQFFTALENSTIQDIEFTSLSFSSSDPTKISIKMSGVAGSINAVALQAEVFSQSGMITSPIFSGINQQQDGVHFDFTGLINPTALKYENLVGGGAQPAATTQQTQQTQQPTSPFTSSSTPATTTQ